MARFVFRLQRVKQVRTIQEAIKTAVGGSEQGSAHGSAEAG